MSLTTPNSIDVGTLKWVRKELDASLKRSRDALEAHVRDGAESGDSLMPCVTALHEVQGVLGMLELKHASALAKEMEKVATALASNAVKNREAGFETLMRGILQLPSYLDRLSSGLTDSPEALAPLVNELRSVRGAAPRVIEKTRQASAFPAHERDNALPSSEVVARKARGPYQTALLKTLQNDKPRAQLSVMRKVAVALQRASEANQAYGFWWLFSALIEALEDGSAVLDKDAKKRLGQVDREIKRLSQGDETEWVANYPQSLSDDIKQAILNSPGTGGLTRAVKDHFASSSDEAHAEEVAALEESLSGVNNQLLETVAAAVREDLATVKDGLDLFKRSPDQDVSELQRLLEPLRKVGDTLAMLGLEVPRAIVQEKYAVIRGIIDGKIHPTDRGVMELASALLYVESALFAMASDDEPGPLGNEVLRNLQRVKAGEEEEGASEYSPMEASLPVSEYRQIVNAVIQESSTDISKAKDAIVTFLDNQTDRSPLQEVPELFMHVRGGLQMLEMERAALCIEAIAYFIGTELVGNHKEMNESEVDALADSISAIEYYMEALSDNRRGRDNILLVAEQGLASLGLNLDNPSGFRAPDEPESASGTPEPVATESAALESAAENATPASLSAVADHSMAADERIETDTIDVASAAEEAQLAEAIGPDASDQALTASADLPGEAAEAVPDQDLLLPDIDDDILVDQAPMSMNEQETVSPVNELDDPALMAAETTETEPGLPDEPAEISAADLGLPDQLDESAPEGDELDLPELESGEGTPFDETVVLPPRAPKVPSSHGHQSHVYQEDGDAFASTESDAEPMNATLSPDEASESSLDIGGDDSGAWHQPADALTADVGETAEANSESLDLPDDIQLTDIELPDDIDLMASASTELEPGGAGLGADEVEQTAKTVDEQIAEVADESFDLDQALEEFETADLDGEPDTGSLSQAGQAEIDGLQAELAAMVEQIEVESGDPLESTETELPVESEIEQGAFDTATVAAPDATNEYPGMNDATDSQHLGLMDASLREGLGDGSESSDDSSRADAHLPSTPSDEAGKWTALPQSESESDDMSDSAGFSVEEVDWDEEASEPDQDQENSTIDLSDELAADMLIAESLEAETPLGREHPETVDSASESIDETIDIGLNVDAQLAEADADDLLDLSNSGSMDDQNLATTDSKETGDWPIEIDGLGSRSETAYELSATEGDDGDSLSAFEPSESPESTISFGDDDDASEIDLSWPATDSNLVEGQGDQFDSGSVMEDSDADSVETLEMSEEVDVIEAGALDDILGDLSPPTDTDIKTSEDSKEISDSLFDDASLAADQVVDEDQWLADRMSTSSSDIESPSQTVAEQEAARPADEPADLEFEAEEVAEDDDLLDSFDHEFDELESLTGDGLAAISDWLDDAEEPPPSETSPLTDAAGFEAVNMHEGAEDETASIEESAGGHDVPDYIREPVAKDADQEILEIFIEEAEEELESVRELLPRWKSDAGDANSRSSIRRSFHTLKGSGRLAGARLLGEYAWSVEHMLNMLIEEQVSAVDDVFIVLDDAVGTVIPHLIGHLNGDQAQTLDVQPYIARAEAVGRGDPLPGLGGAVSGAEQDQMSSVEGQDAASEPAYEPRMDPVLYEIFSKETAGYVEAVRDFADQALIRGDTRINEGLVRALHTLQGSAHMAGVVEIADLSGAMDGYVKSLYKNGRKLERDDLDLLVEASDVIDQIQRDLNRPGADLPDIGPMLEMIAQRYATRMPENIEVRRPNLGEIAAKMPTFGSNDGELAPARSPDSEPSTSEPPVTEPTESRGEVLAEPETAPEAAQASDTYDSIDSGGEGSILAADPELLEIFLQEAEEILDAAEVSLDYWNKHRDERGVVAELQRGLHTLKGGARMAGIQSIAELSHGLETLFSAVVEETVTTSDHTLEVIQASFDKLVVMLESIRAGREPQAEADLVEVLDKARAGKTLPVTRTPEPAPEAISAPPADERPAVVPEDPEPSQPSEQPPVETRVEAEIEAIPAQIEMVSEPPAPASEAATTRADAVRVDVDLLGGLVNLAGEVSIYRSRLEQKLGTFQFNLGELDQTVTRLKDQLRHLDIETEAQILSRFDRDKDDRADDFDPLEFDRFSQLQQLSRGLMESITDVLNLKHVLDEETRETETLLVQQARVNTNLQEGLMRTRMVPFSGLVPRLRRILRQTSRELGKRAELDVTGGEGELDRSVLERITAPLEHMVRNAVFHGIETPEVREAAGKSPIGKLTISLSRRGPEMIIRVTDDGQGIDIEAVRRKATERGLIDSGMEISDHDLQQVIMEPGFTTAKKVTQISGRGVGMDVVYSELKQLGGSLEIDSTASGTSFTMYLPFTLAVNRALLARVADEVYAVPLAALDGVVRLGRQDLERVYSAETPLYQYGGETYLVQYLGAMVGSSLPDLPDKGETLPVLLIRAGDQRVALQVDGLMGSREIVVKSLGPQLAKVPGIAGATILGDGRVVLILEVSTLLRREVSPQYQRLRKMAEKRKASQGAAPVKVMVVDDSITMRKVATRLLERQGMEVTTAKDGVDALARLHETVPDVMLLDIEMPRMDGYELAGRMRRDPRFEEIPIIMITSRTGSKHRDRATELGVNRYLGKPYQEADLLHHIRELAAEVRAKQ